MSLTTISLPTKITDVALSAFVCRLFYEDFSSIVRAKLIISLSERLFLFPGNCVQAFAACNTDPPCQLRMAEFHECLSVEQDH